MTDLETLACRLREAAFPYSTSWFTVSVDARARWLRVARETQRHADASVRRALLSAAEMADEIGQPEAAKMLRDCVAGTEASHPRHGRHGRIAAAAIRLPDGTILTLPPPARHHDIGRHFGVMAEPDQQGFVTDQGKWARRMLALRIARAAGQVIRETAPAHGLFSEDLW